MNYRHAFHAGNAADCVKHALLVWLLHAMRRKPAPFAVIDTHAGTGRSDLAGEQAGRTGEWRSGIARLWPDPPDALREYVALALPDGLPGNAASPVAPPVTGLPAPLIASSVTAHDAVPGAGPGAVPGVVPGAVPGAGPPSGPVVGDAPPARPYLGSAALARALLRPGDRLVCCELHPDDHAALRRLFRDDRQVFVHHRDGHEALRAFLPPPERRALVLIDPPFEAPGEFARLAATLAAAHARFPSGVLAAWYPVKHRAPVRAFHDAVRDATPALRDVVAAELWLRAPLDPARLNGCGLLVVNPPWRFEQEAPGLLSALLDRLGTAEAGQGAAVTRLVDE